VIKVGYAMCGSFCTLTKTMESMKKLSEEYSIQPIMSTNTYTTDTRFGKAEEFIDIAKKVSGKEVLHTIVDTEPIGPKKLIDIMIVAPCTGNTLSKIANGITDTPVTMAVKSSLRIGAPVLLCIASNDSLGASGMNISKLINTKNIFFVPMEQDDAQTKPFSLVSDFSLLPKAIESALKKEQLQPIYKVK